MKGTHTFLPPPPVPTKGVAKRFEASSWEPGEKRGPFALEDVEGVAFSLLVTT